MRSETQFIARQPWQSDRPESLVVCCSDGRWHAQVEEFIQNQISSRADLCVMPGGPATFSIWSSSFEETRAIEKSFRFMATHHKIKSVWLIAHENCAYYLNKLSNRDGLFVRQRQIEDLGKAEAIIRKWYQGLGIKKVYAYVEQGLVKFQMIE